MHRDRIRFRPHGATSRLLASVAVALLLAAGAVGQVRLHDEDVAHDPSRPAEGLWAGNLQIDGQWRYGIVRIEHDTDAGAWSVTATVAIVLALGSAATEVEIEDRAVAFTVRGQMGVLRLDGAVDESGRRMTGTVTRRGDEPVEGTFELARTPAVMSLPRPLAFTGEIDVQGMMKLGMTIAVARTPGGRWVGHVDIPAQMTRGFVLANVEREGNTLTGTLPGPVPAFLEVEVSEDERRLTGTMKQGPFTLPIDFSRDEGYVGPELRRPQHPAPPYPYRSEEVTITHPDGHVLAGTLTLPDVEAHGEGPYAAVVLVSGSGPQDRDETVMGHKPFLVIADHLTRNGIAVLRYDDRGAGSSTGDFAAATSEDFASDALAAVRFARARAATDPDRIGVLGHSEGALVGPMVAGLDPELAFLVLLAGPGVPGEDILILQAEKVMRAEGSGEAMIEANRRQQRAIFDAMRELGADATEEAIDEKLRPVLEQAAAALEQLDEGSQLGDLLEAQLQQLASPWMRFFLTYDPRPALAAVRCPVLAMNGTLDLQVWHEQNLDEIERVLREAGRDVTIKRYEGLNHLFQPATTGGVSEYAEIETTMDERVLEDIVGWIERTVGTTSTPDRPNA